MNNYFDKLTERFAGALFFAILTILLVLIAMLIGCETTNPLCTDSFCIVPRDNVEGDIIEIDETKLIALIAKTSDATPTSPVETIPAETTPAASPTLADIITDVAAGETTYLNQTVTVTGYVVWKNDVGDVIVIYRNANFLEANQEDAGFYILSKVDGDFLEFASYRVGSSYTLTLTINSILPPEGNQTRYLIGARLAD